MSRIIAALLAATLLGGCSRKTSEEPPAVVVAPQPDDGSVPPPQPVSVRTPDEALAVGVAFLLKQQSEDGSWRSDVYATFKDGTALTPLAVTALQDAHNGERLDKEVATAIAKGLAWLAKLSKPDGTVDPGPDGFDYPIYTATLTIKAFSHPTGKEHLKLRDGWVQYVKERQLTEKLGWKSDEKQYGGWGYCRVIPMKPEPGKFAPPLIESNLSATLFALDALRGAGDVDAELYKAAEVFIRHCQNEDGGFHFIYDDPVRNKAGKPSDQPHTFHSYGSTSADGFRALILCGAPVDSEWRVKARLWLVKNFRADTHPGTYVKAHEPNREAVYYYYAASVAKAFREIKMTKAGGVDWAVELAAELAKRQRDDGSWANTIELVRENDPIVATCNAVSALARCNR